MMIDEAAKDAKKAIGCVVHKRKKFYRKSGFSEVRSLQHIRRRISLQVLVVKDLPAWNSMVSKR